MKAYVFVIKRKFT